MKKRYSTLEVEVLATLSGDISIRDITNVDDPEEVWVEYCKADKEEIKNAEPKKKKKKYYTYRRREHYPRDEPAYNKAQEDEFPRFIKYLEPVVNYVLDVHMLPGSSFEHYERLHDGLICLCIKGYFGKSLRRSMGVIRYVVSKDFPDVKVPCFKTLNSHQNNPVFSFYVDKIIEATAKSLNKLEVKFTTDGTGEATFSYSTWYSIKAEKKLRRRDHKIAEVTSTILLNAAVVVDVLDHESPSLMQEHVEITSQSFTIRDWSADNLYLTRNNCTSVRIPLSTSL